MGGSRAQRMRFVLDLGFGTGLRASELVGATLGNIEIGAGGDAWLHVVGKGSKAGKVVLPPIARGALETYLVQRRLPVSPAKWDPRTPLLGSLDGEAGITARRLWAAMKLLRDGGRGARRCQHGAGREAGPGLSALASPQPRLVCS